MSEEFMAGKTLDTHRVNGDNCTNPACLHKQRLERRGLPILPSIHQSQQSLVGVGERGARHAEEGVGNLRRIKTNAFLGKCLLQSSDDRSNQGRCKRCCLPSPAWVISTSTAKDGKAERELTEVLKPLNRSEEMPSMKESWSKPVTHTLLFGEPKNLVGVKAPSEGSNDPVSTVRAHVSQEGRERRCPFAHMQ